MKELLVSMMRIALRFLLSFRYDVRLQGIRSIDESDKPTVVLCNHPAYIDPMIVYAFLPTRTKIRPLVYYGAFRLPILKRLFNLVGAIEVADFAAPEINRENCLDQLLEEIQQKLSDGIILMHPSGRLQRDGREIIGGTRVAYELLCQNPGVRVVMVRSMGLWGSCFSCAERGRLPNLRKSISKSISCFFLNFGVFIPKRRVTLQIDTKQSTDFDLSSRFALNRDLESWFEYPVVEFPEFVPHFFWGPRTSPGNTDSNDVGDISVPAKIVFDANKFVVNYVNVNTGNEICMNQLEGDTDIVSLGLDSLDAADFEIVLGEHLNISIGTSPKCMEDVWRLFNRSQKEEVWHS